MSWRGYAVIALLVISGWACKGVVPYLDPTTVGPQGGATVGSVDVARQPNEGDLGWVPALDGNGLGRTHWERMPLVPR